MARPDGRTPYQLRQVKIQRGYLDYAAGSCLIEFDKTRVLCAASVEETKPAFLKEGRGWLTAEYGMLPKSSPHRIPRDSGRSRPQGRTFEIQRLIGRSLRAVVDLDIIGERSITIDCDVIQADGGTRTAAITGAYVALVDCVRLMQEAQMIPRWPIRDSVAAVSVGIVDGVKCLDLAYQEDSIADVDLNAVMTGSGKFIEIQGTAEGEPFDQPALMEMLDLARRGIESLTLIQKQALDEQ